MGTNMTIAIDRLKIFAHHGVTDQEQTVGNQFEVSCSLTCGSTKSILTDNISDTVNYAEIIRIIKSEMDKPSRLIEHAAGRIMTAIQTTYPQITGGSIKVSKLCPPCGAETAGVSVTVTW